MEIKSLYSKCNSDKISEISEDIKELYIKILKEKKRAYSEPWDDWSKGPTGKTTTGGQEYACVYILLSGEEKGLKNPVYVGETTNLGARLWQHKQPTNNWSRPWKYVQYISDEKLEDWKLRLLFESFLICILDPTDNNPKRENIKK